MKELERARQDVLSLAVNYPTTAELRLAEFERLVREDERRVTVGLCLRGFANYFRMEVADVIKFFPKEFEPVLQDAARET